MRSGVERRAPRSLDCFAGHLRRPKSHHAAPQHQLAQPRFLSCSTLKNRIHGLASLPSPPSSLYSPSEPSRYCAHFSIPTTPALEARTPKGRKCTLISHMPTLSFSCICHRLSDTHTPHIYTSIYICIYIDVYIYTHVYIEDTLP